MQFFIIFVAGVKAFANKVALTTHHISAGFFVLRVIFDNRKLGV
jgi:hypothetical protein